MQHGKGDGIKDMIETTTSHTATIDLMYRRLRSESRPMLDIYSPGQKQTTLVSYLFVLRMRLLIEGVKSRVFQLLVVCRLFGTATELRD